MPFSSGRVTVLVLGFVLLGLPTNLAGQDRPPPPPLEGPQTGSQLAEFLYGSKTPYEFWLTVFILLFGVVMSVVTTTFLRRAVHLKTDEAIRALVILWVVIATLVLITAGYSNQQVAPAFGLFGTIIGYILGKLERGGASVREQSNGAGAQPAQGAADGTD